jgi:hypothetical protein
MKINVEIWPVQKLVEQKDQINSQPKYQRGEVWTPQKKKLLIDSMLRGIDLPKIYLRKLDRGSHQFEIADGQQRVSAIYNFLSDAVKLDYKKHNGLDLTQLFGDGVSNPNYSTLPDDLKAKIQDYPLTIAIVEDASHAEVRTLFGRLQLGSQLNSAEKRNAIISSAGDHIDGFARNHIFFQNSKIPVSRYKHQDYLAHALALVFYENRKELKGELLEELYLDSKIDFNAMLMNNVAKVLDLMNDLNLALNKKIVNKFTFIDFFKILYDSVDILDHLDVMGMANEFREFERLRLECHKKPEVLLEKETVSDYDKNLFSYIEAFRYEGANPRAINKRNEVFVELFTKYF